MEQCLLINVGKSVLVYNSISTQKGNQKLGENKDILGHVETQKISYPSKLPEDKF